MTKEEIRGQSLGLRNQMTQEDVDQKSEAILKRLEDLDVFQSAQSILFYVSVNNEVQTIPFIKKYLKEKKIYLPRLISDNQFEAVFCDDYSALKKNKFGILEPENTSIQKKISLDLILIPGVAFDQQGNRIGMGKGYYDRFLVAHKNSRKMALAYEKQILDQLPKDLYDEPVDMIVTEQRIVDCQGHRF